MPTGEYFSIFSSYDTLYNIKNVIRFAEKCSIDYPDKYKNLDLTIELYPFLFYFIKCHDTNKTHHKEGDLIFRCPDACDIQRCNNVEYGIENFCKTKGLGIYATSYDCKCRDNALWSTHSKKCYAENPCKNNICNDNECEFDYSNLEYKCRCGDKTMGRHCDEPRDACKENYFGATLNGNTQCSRGGGGMCQSFPGLNFYKCKCNTGWTNDKTQIFANCNKRIETCESHICHYGHCDHINGTGDAYCKCDEDWEGKKCNIRSAIWFPWGQWSKGSDGEQKRRRDCSKNNGNCNRAILGNEETRKKSAQETNSKSKSSGQSKMFRKLYFYKILFSSIFLNHLLNCFGIE